MTNHATPIAGYDELTAEDVVGGLPELDAEELVAVREYETAEKNRSTITEAVNRRLNALEQESADTDAAYPDPPAGRPPLSELADSRATPPVSED